MIVCVDVDYRATEVVAACVGLHDWVDAAPALESVTRIPGAPPAYESGAFYRREMPYLIAALAAIPAAPRTVVVDGYVWLSPGRPGLGAHLHTALGGGIEVVGVAKRNFEGAVAMPVLRGMSRQPLFVTTTGDDVAAVAAAVRSMHGVHRIPTLLKRVDRLARDA
ncbi:MAG: endonuclease V [Deltaproteobacteria bacterium]|nr:MAG: endonuclease V [Deltaproteobacteria bacterium]